MPAITLLVLLAVVMASQAYSAAQSDEFDTNHFFNGWGRPHTGGSKSLQRPHHSSRKLQHFPQWQPWPWHDATHSAQHASQNRHHSVAGPSQSSSQHISQSAHPSGSAASVASASAVSSAPASSSSATDLDPKPANCQVAIPCNALTAEGLSTPWELLPPCSQAVPTQQAFAEAAIIDSNGQISIYHPLVIDKGRTPLAAPIIPKLDNASHIALFFGFNGDVLTLVDVHGRDTNASPILKTLDCINGLRGVPNDVFGQVSWCNTHKFWKAANAAVKRGKLQIPPLGTNTIGKPCLSARSFEIIDQDQSDNLPTKYLLLDDGSTVQSTAANKAKFHKAVEIDNASDESLIADFVDPAIGCTPFTVDSLDDPGVKVPSLATNELQALFTQQEPIALIPLNNPDTVLTSSGKQSVAKTNQYRQGVNQPLLDTASKTDDGNGQTYCDNLVEIQPPFLASFQDKFSNVSTPDAGIGNNLFTFLCNRFLQSLPNLGCQNKRVPVKCKVDSKGLATSCTIRIHDKKGQKHGAHTHHRASRARVSSASQAHATTFSSVTRSQSLGASSSSASQKGSECDDSG